MADEADGEETESEEPAVELGEGRSVEGAPLARVTSRLTWGIERSEVRRKEGDTQIRTPEGPRPLAELLDETDTSYFATRREFEEAVRAVAGHGPVATAEE